MEQEDQTSASLKNMLQKTDNIKAKPNFKSTALI